MRIGYLAPEFPGQTHSFLWREIRALRAMGVEIDIVATRPSPAANRPHSWCEQAIRETFYLHPLPATAALRAAADLRFSRETLGALRDDAASASASARRIALTLYASRLLKRARERQWSHIHVHSCANAAMIAMLARTMGGPPYSVVLHGPLEDYGEGQRAKWRRAEFGVVITKQLREEVDRELAGALPGGGIEIAPMGVDIEHFRRSAPYEPWAGHGPLRIVTCGRLHPRKGHRDLIEAVAILRRRAVDARLRILGEGDDRPVLEAKIRELGLQDFVSLAGACDEEVVRSALEESHVFVLASHAEPLGVVIMEAMAMGTPLVATAAGGVPEMIESGANGLLVPIQRPDEIVTAVLSIAQDPAVARRLGAAGRRTTESRFHSGVSAGMVARRLGLTPAASTPSAHRAASNMGAVA